MVTIAGALDNLEGTPRARTVPLATQLAFALDRHVMAQLGHAIDPDAVSIEALRSMRHHVVYLGERTVSGIVRRPDLYSVAHDSPAIKAEVEAWLWPLLERLTSVAARAFVYGAASVVFDWTQSDLVLRVPTKDGMKTRRKRVPGHVHYGAAVPLATAGVTLEVDDQDELVAVRARGKRYPADRAYVWVWDSEPESPWAGQGARRRAWTAFCEDALIRHMRNKSLERNTDPPRVGRAPPGRTTLGDGTSLDNSELLSTLLATLRGSGEITLPSTRDDSGNEKWGVSLLEASTAPAEIFDKALERCEQAMLMAYLVVPSMGGLDVMGSAAGRTLQEMLREFVEDLATFVAGGLTRIVATVHARNHGPEVAAPEIVVTDVGKAGARKTLQALLQLANANPAGEIARRLDVPRSLDRLGAPLRDEPPPDVAGQPAQGTQPVGRPRDYLGDREQRREDAVTPEGEDAIGAPGESID